MNEELKQVNVEYENKINQLKKENIEYENKNNQLIKVMLNMKIKIINYIMRMKY